MQDDFKRVLRAGSDPVVFFRGQDTGEGAQVAKGHIMAAAMSHALTDGDVVVMGANSMIPLAAARLAQLTHAPNLTMIAGASGGVNTLVEPLAPSSGDYANLVAEAVLQFPEVLMVQMSGLADVFFAGGLQVDRRGNTNLNFIGSREKPALRGPGAAGLPWGQRCHRTIIYTTSHDKRVFVPEVDFVSMSGWKHGQGPASHENGPVLVVTPLAVLDFNREGNMRLQSLHPGVDLDVLRDSTGFHLALPERDVPVTPEPTRQELSILRDIDPDALLSIVI